MPGQKSKARLVESPRACECGDHSFISLTKGYLTIFDTADEPLVWQGSWWASVRDKTVYAMRTVGGKNIRLHREIMKAERAIEVDHWNGDGLNNKRMNLRKATHSQNQRNTTSRTGSSSRYLGVSIDNRYNPPRWKASIQSDGKLRMIGRFIEEIPAALAYDEEAIRVHGEFASRNFPKEKAAASS